MILYRATMTKSEDGLGILYDEWHSIYETKCFYMCVPDLSMVYYRNMSVEEVKSKFKKDKRRFKRIAKKFSRFACTEKDHALASLLARKKAQIVHCQRNIAICQRNIAMASQFIEEIEKDFSSYACGNVIIKDTIELVSEWYRFD
jgi:hypothetical protein